MTAADTAAEIARRRLASDLVTLAEFTVSDAADFVAVAGEILRPCDRYGVTGTDAWVLAYGADDRDLAEVVARLDGRGALYRIALGPDLVKRTPDLAVVPSTITLPAVPAA